MSLSYIDQIQQIVDVDIPLLQVITEPNKQQIPLRNIIHHYGGSSYNITKIRMLITKQILSMGSQLSEQKKIELEFVLQLSLRFRYDGFTNLILISQDNSLKNCVDILLTFTIPNFRLSNKWIHRIYEMSQNQQIKMSWIDDLYTLMSNPSCSAESDRVKLSGWNSFRMKQSEQLVVNTCVIKDPIEQSESSTITDKWNCLSRFETLDKYDNFQFIFDSMISNHSSFNNINFPSKSTFLVVLNRDFKQQFEDYSISAADISTEVSNDENIRSLRSFYSEIIDRYLIFATKLDNIDKISNFDIKNSIYALISQYLIDPSDYDIDRFVEFIYISSEKLGKKCTDKDLILFNVAFQTLDCTSGQNKTLDEFTAKILSSDGLEGLSKKRIESVYSSTNAQIAVMNAKQKATTQKKLLNQMNSQA